jgi:hypothetical protein
MMTPTDGSPEEDTVHELRGKVEKTREISFPSSGSAREIFRTSFRICRPVQVGSNSITYTSLMRDTGDLKLDVMCPATADLSGRL